MCRPIPSADASAVRSSCIRRLRGVFPSQASNNWGFSRGIQAGLVGRLRFRQDATPCFSNNLLYPRPRNKILYYACRNCDHEELADSNCVYRNEVHHSASEHSQVLPDLMDDPAIPRTKTVNCPKCGHSEAAYYQAPARGAERRTTVYACCNNRCGYKWRE